MKNFRISHIIFLFICYHLSSCSIFKHNPCIVSSFVEKEFDKTAINQTICFETIDSYDMDFKNKMPLTIFGHLSFPEIKKEKYSAVILTHGAGGIRKYHQNYVDLFNDNGYVVFQIDHYTPRNIRYDKTFTKISGITFMIDAFSALKLLKSHPLINKIGYIGWSQGGVGPILSHFPEITKLINSNKFSFDAAIAIYPYCGFTFPDNFTTSTPLLMITGKKDMLTPEQACRNFYSKFFRGDGKIKHISLDEAHHGYDNPFLYFGFTIDTLPSLIITNDACTLTISEKGRIITMTKKDVSSTDTSNEFLKQCSKKGVEIKYNEGAAKKTKKIILNFFKNNSFG